MKLKVNNKNKYNSEQINKLLNNIIEWFLKVCEIINYNKYLSYCCGFDC